MARNFSTQLMPAFLALAILSLTAACGSNVNSSKALVHGETCLKPQALRSAYQDASFSAASQGASSHRLLLKMQNPDRDFADFKAQIESEFEHRGKGAQVTRISQRTVAVDLPSGNSSSQAIESAIEAGKLIYLEPDYPTFSLEATPTFEKSSAAVSEAELPLDQVRAQAGGEIIVAVIDSGVDDNHKDLAPYMWTNPGEVAGNGIDDDQNGYVDDVHGWDFVGNDNDPMADDADVYHGTHVAGIIRQAALLEEKGVKVRIMALKYLDSSASGRTSNAIRAIDYAIANGAKILNNSWGALNYSALLSDAIERARRANVLFVAAAGNGDSSGKAYDLDQIPFYPAAFPHANIISVSAVDDRNQMPAWANFGKSTVDLTAPGVGIVSTRNGNTYGTLSGTSMATPFVSGVASLLWALKPELSALDIKKLILENALKVDALQGRVLTGATVNRAESLKAVGSFVHDPSSETPAPSESLSSCPP